MSKCVHGAEIKMSLYSQVFHLLRCAKCFFLLSSESYLYVPWRWHNLKIHLDWQTTRRRNRTASKEENKPWLRSKILKNTTRAEKPWMQGAAGERCERAVRRSVQSRLGPSALPHVSLWFSQLMKDHVTTS